MAMSGGRGSILVSGDCVLDHHIYEGRRHHYGDGVSRGVNVVSQAGGAALVQRLLEELLRRKQGEEWTTHLSLQAPVPWDPAVAVDPSQHAYAFWRPFPRGEPIERQRWRVSEAMGFGDARAGEECSAWPAAEGLPAQPRLIVLSEGGMGFRREPARWERLDFAGARWILLKTAAPVAEGPLWDRLAGAHAGRLVVVASSEDLRRGPARIGAGLSWEETVENLLRELREGGALEALSRCRHLVVAFGSEAGLSVDFADRARPAVRLVYDAAAIEGEEARAVEGAAFGYLSCLCAAVAWQITLDEERPDLEGAIEGGLSAMRDLRRNGHGPAIEPGRGFPAGRLAAAILHPEHVYCRARVPPAPAPEWTLLGEARRAKDPAFDLARLLVLRGPIAIRNLPHCRIGKLLSAERREVERLRTLDQTVRRYLDRDPGRKPLSIAVFGPPGAGKSFAVGELVEQLVGREGRLDFNLAQFDDARELIGAFHRIRDRVLEGRRTAAFFDEFDASGYRWLKHLLAPMQDGRFQEGQITHPLGKCILIFAGGTSPTFEAFGAQSGGRFTEAFTLAKGPDFKSRIDACLDVAGTNPAGDDPGFPIRRALIIRAELSCRPDEKLAIDEGILQALLRAKSFTHGARSLGKILEPLKAARPGPLHVSHLPPPAQLAMHTDAEEFLRLASIRPGRSFPAPMTEDEVEAMAPAIHRTYLALGRRAGWLAKEADIPFESLGEFQKESNRAAARRMPGILALADLRLAKGLAGAAEEEEVRQHLEFRLDLLAEAEHEGWMDWHLRQGWRFRPRRDDAERYHPSLRPFAELTDADKNKDRDSVRHYPDFARAADRKVEFVPPA